MTADRSDNARTGWDDLIEHIRDMTWKPVSLDTHLDAVAAIMSGAKVYEIANDTSLSTDKRRELLQDLIDTETKLDRHDYVRIDSDYGIKMVVFTAAFARVLRDTVQLGLFPPRPSRENPDL